MKQKILFAVMLLCMATGVAKAQDAVQPTSIYNIDLTT